MLARAWDVLLDFLAVANRVRFSAVLVLAGSLVLIFHDQGQEIVLLVGAAGAGAIVAFAAAVAGWGLSAWYCARTLCDRPFPSRPETPALKWLTDHLPRLIGAGAFGGTAAAFWHQSDLFLAVVFAVLLVAFYVFALVRRKGALRQVLALPPADQRTRTAAKNLFDLPLATRNIFIVLLVAAAVAMVAAIVAPVAIGTALGPGTIATAGFALIIPVGTLLVLSSLNSGFPVITALVAAAVLFSLFNDNHALRQAPGLQVERTASDAPGFATRDGREVVVRPTLRELYDQWHLAQCGENEACMPPLVIVATAGGGSRAAFWTATVLGELSDLGLRLSAEAPAGFGDRLFALSGVSGGALGGVVYRALLADRQRRPSEPAACADDWRTLRPCGQAVAGGEFLGPVLLTTLYPDLLQRFLPVALFDDRAATLETSWERQWTKALPGSPVRLSDGLMSLWSTPVETGSGPTHRFWPALYLNGTHVETGRRIITSNVGLDRSSVAVGAKAALVHADAFDFYAVHACDIPASTAADNAARFPYVGPAGRIRRDCEGDDWGHIVDGGYFENFGAQTALEILQALVGYAEASGRRFRPVVIQISSDPAFDGRFTGAEHDGLIEASPKFNRIANEALSPLKAFMGLREAQGRRAFGQLALGVESAARRLRAAPAGEPEEVAAGGEDGAATAVSAEATTTPAPRPSVFAHFRMCPASADGSARTPALGWSLSAEAKATIDGYLPVAAIDRMLEKARAEGLGFCEMEVSGSGCVGDNVEALKSVICALADR